MLVTVLNSLLTELFPANSSLLPITKIAPLYRLFFIAHKKEEPEGSSNRRQKYRPNRSLSETKNVTKTIIPQD